MLRARSIPSYLACLVVMLCADSKAANQPAWQINSTHFTVITDAGEKKGREIAFRFEQMRAVFATLLGKDRLNQSVPLTIVALASDKAYYQAAPLRQGQPIGVPGFLVRGDDQDDDVGHLGAAGAHGGEGLVAGRVQEHDRPPVDIHTVGPDVLGDPAGLALRDLRRFLGDRGCVFGPAKDVVEHLERERAGVPGAEDVVEERRQVAHADREVADAGLGAEAAWTGGRRTVVFAKNVAHAQELVGQFVDAGSCPAPDDPKPADDAGRRTP